MIGVTDPEVKPWWWKEFHARVMNGEFHSKTGLKFNPLAQFIERVANGAYNSGNLNGERRTGTGVRKRLMSMVVLPGRSPTGEAVDWITREDVLSCLFSDEQEKLR